MIMLIRLGGSCGLRTATPNTDVYRQCAAPLNLFAGLNTLRRNTSVCHAASIIVILAEHDVMVSGPRFRSTEILTHKVRDFHQPGLLGHGQSDGGLLRVHLGPGSKILFQDSASSLGTRLDLLHHRKAGPLEVVTYFVVAVTLVVAYGKSDEPLLMTRFTDESSLTLLPLVGSVNMTCPLVTELDA